MDYMHNKIFLAFFMILIASISFSHALQIDEGESFTLTDGIKNEYDAVLTKVNSDESFIITLEGEDYEMEKGKLKIINRGEIKDLEIFVNEVLYQDYTGGRSVLMNEFEIYDERVANEGNYIAILGNRNEVPFDFEIIDQGKATLIADGDKKTVNEGDVVDFKGMNFFVSEILYQDYEEFGMIELGFSEGGIIKREGFRGSTGGECEAKAIVSAGEIITVTLGKSYNVRIEFMDSDGVKFNVNGEITDLLGKDDEFRLSDGAEIELEEIISGDSETTNKAEFKIESDDCGGSPGARADDFDDDSDGDFDDDSDDSKAETVCINQCSLDGKCYPLGYRTGGKYCSGDYVFTAQSSEGMVCENNFECDSNVCVDGQCISGNLIQKILNWFKGIFG